MTLQEQYMMPCLNKKIFGFDCLGCGLQRAVNLLFHGEFVAAFKMYAAVYPLILLFVFIGVNLFFKFKSALAWSFFIDGTSIKTNPAEGKIFKRPF